MISSPRTKFSVSVSIFVVSTSFSDFNCSVNLFYKKQSRHLMSPCHLQFRKICHIRKGLHGVCKCLASDDHAPCTFDSDIKGCDFFISAGRPAKPPITNDKFAPPSSSPLYTTFEKSLDEYSEPFSSRAITTSKFHS